MKKFFLVAIVAFALTSCTSGNGEAEVTATTDSTKVDSAAVVATPSVCCDSLAADTCKK